MTVDIRAHDVADVRRDIRVQGWRGRRRFRHDLPVMAAAGIGQA